MPDTPETVLAFDFGKRRIGVAVGQQITASASPLPVIDNTDADSRQKKIDAIVREWRPNRLLVGMPLNADGSASDMAEAVATFMTELQHLGVPVDSVDERYSSIDAEARLKMQRRAGLTRRISKGMVDSGAAVEIAERWLKNEN